MREKDAIYATPHTAVEDFVFDDTVAEVFPDMLKRSVPGYPAIINMIQLLAAEHAQPDSQLYDLGCSLGASTVAMAEGLEVRGCRIIAVDNAPAMIHRARYTVKSDRADLEFVEADIQDVRIERASMVVLNFTLQFLPRDERKGLLRGIHQGLLPGGVLVLSEKVAGHDEQADRMLSDMHHAFKRANGYSDLEISQKRSALENVLIPETVTVHEQRLLDAGFSRVDQWFQCFNFVSFVARV